MLAIMVVTLQDNILTKNSKRLPKQLFVFGENSIILLFFANDFAIDYIKIKVILSYDLMH